MKKTILKLGLGGLLTASALIPGEAMLPYSGMVLAADPPTITAPAETKTIQGKIANISQKAKTLALATADGQFFLMKFTDATVFKGGAATDFKEDEAIVALYTMAGDENIAASIEKDVVKLPEGIAEIKTAELAKRLTTGDANTVIIDSRPAVKFDEGHIPGAVSIPLAKLMAAGDDGAKLLAPYQDRQLIFYCGGST